MKIVCPNCQASYAIPDNAIGPAGRKVRCAECGHQWHQSPLDADMGVEEAAAVSDQSEPAIDRPETQAAADKPAPEPLAEQELEEAAPAPQEKEGAEPAPPVDEPAEPDSINAQADDATPAPVAIYHEENLDTAPEAGAKTEYAPVAEHTPETRSRPWARIAMGVILLAVLIGGAIYYYGLPQGLASSELATAKPQVPGLEINLPVSEDDRRTLPDGTELFAASGTIVNTGSERRDVPDMLIVLRNADDRIVYEQEIRAPVKTLGPGEEARFDEALLDIPRSAIKAEIDWAPGAL